MPRWNHVYKCLAIAEKTSEIRSVREKRISKKRGIIKYKVQRKNSILILKLSQSIQTHTDTQTCIYHVCWQSGTETYAQIRQRTRNKQQINYSRRMCSTSTDIGGNDLTPSRYPCEGSVFPIVLILFFPFYIWSPFPCSCSCGFHHLLIST